MEMPKILVVGSNGQLGSELQELSQETAKYTFIFVDVEQLDITDINAVNNYFSNNKIDICINCAAYTAVDKAESDKEKANLINVLGCENLASVCKQYDAVLFHISTDFVFDGSKNKPYGEDDTTSPISVYGDTKLQGEEKVANICEKYFIIRTSWLYSSYGNNFVKTMIKLGETKESLGIIIDQIGTPTYARDLAKSIMKMIESNTDENYGLYHYSNEGVASWYDFAKSIFRHCGNDKIIVNPIPTTSYPTPAKRPTFSLMDKTKIKSVFNLAIPHWEDSLLECLNKLQK